MTEYESRAAYNASRAGDGDASRYPVAAHGVLEVTSDPSILPLWARRIFYIAGALGGVAAIIVQGYDPQLGANIAGASVVLVSSLALANPTRR